MPQTRNSPHLENTALLFLKLPTQKVERIFHARGVKLRCISSDDQCRWPSILRKVVAGVANLVRSVLAKKFRLPGYQRVVRWRIQHCKFLCDESSKCLLSKL